MLLHYSFQVASMNTCMFCGSAIGHIPISYHFELTRGDNEEPVSGAGHAHVKCIIEFERAQFDYEQIAQDLIAEWENDLTRSDSQIA